MSNPGKSLNPLTTLVVTGNPKVDAIIRYALVAACGAMTGVIMTWLNAHGFNDPNLNLMISGAVASVIGGAVLALWGVIRASKIEAIVQFREAIGVQAGMNLAAAGQMEVTEQAGAVVPVPVTVQSAQQIIAQHATPIAGKS